MSKNGNTRGQTPIPGFYNDLLETIDDLTEMFRQVSKPKIFWWSMTVPEDITASGGIDVAMYRWGELLQTDYRAELCNVGGVGTRDRSQWILYAITGEGVSLKCYRKVADVCASAVKALAIPTIAKFKPAVLEKLDISGDFKCFKSLTPAKYKKFTDWRESSLKSLWITEQPIAKLSVSEYLDALAASGNGRLPVSGGSTVESYWILNWFEYIFGTAQEPGCLIRVHSGSQYATGWEVAEIPFRRIDHDICEASILALKFLRKTAKVRVQEKDGQRNVIRRKTTKQASGGGSKSKPMSARDQVFISYSRKDKRWLTDLKTHLKPYVRSGSLTAWSDEQIALGSKWLREIETALDRTKVAVLLVTANFLASDFIHEHELTPLLKEAEKGEVCVIWIPIGACSYKETTLKDYEAAIDPNKPLARINKADRDEVWVRICEKIKKVVSRS